MVGEVGLEPTRIATLDPKKCQRLDSSHTRVGFKWTSSRALHVVAPRLARALPNITMIFSREQHPSSI